MRTHSFGLAALLVAVGSKTIEKIQKDRVAGPGDLTQATQLGVASDDYGHGGTRDPRPDG
jgi:hypothetical protein